MQYYLPSIPAIECPPLVPDNTPILVCPSCGDTMKHLRTIPKFGARLEQFIFNVGRNSPLHAHQIEG